MTGRNAQFTQPSLESSVESDDDDLLGALWQWPAIFAIGQDSLSAAALTLPQQKIKTTPLIHTAKRTAAAGRIKLLTLESSALITINLSTVGAPQQ